VLRTDISMSSGKAMAQAGHAYVAAALGSLETPEGSAYAALTPGTKICLAGGSEDDLRALEVRLLDAGIPSYPIIDRDHVELPDFDGSPILTALGIGPLSRAQAPGALRKLKLFGHRKS
jgi:PTH2 family peptidyl-tRNA hydrolase